MQCNFQESNGISKEKDCSVALLFKKAILFFAEMLIALRLFRQGTQGSSFVAVGVFYKDRIVVAIQISLIDAIMYLDTLFW
jgi:hypothetical protein